MTAPGVRGRACRTADRRPSLRCYVPPEEYDSDFDDETYRPIDFTDVGQALVLFDKFSDRLRYSPATDYLVYNGVYVQALVRDRGRDVRLREDGFQASQPGIAKLSVRGSSCQLMSVRGSIDTGVDRRYDIIEKSG